MAEPFSVWQEQANELCRLSAFMLYKEHVKICPNAYCGRVFIMDANNKVSFALCACARSGVCVTSIDRAVVASML